MRFDGERAAKAFTRFLAEAFNVWLERGVDSTAPTGEEYVEIAVTSDPGEGELETFLRFIIAILDYMRGVPGRRWVQHRFRLYWRVLPEWRKVSNVVPTSRYVGYARLLASDKEVEGE